MSLARRIRSRARRWLGLDDLDQVRRAVIPLNDTAELRRAFGWSLEPILDDPQIHRWEYLEDANQRRVRDADCLATVVRNARPAVCLDIGTATGRSAALMSVNAPESRVFTVNIPPEEIASGDGGEKVTRAFERNEIGSYYRERGLTNITQILANTARWEPDVGTIDVAFIDGCHDAEFVYNDTKKVLRHMRRGSFVLWHDFHPGLVEPFDWIHDVCRGVDRLLAEGLVQGRILHVRDSWTGIYRVGGLAAP